MAQHKTLAERILFLRDETGKRKRITVRIGMPYWVETNREAACPVEVKGLYEDLADIHGSDPYQAVELAITFANTLLSKSQTKHRKLYWATGEPYSIKAPPSGRSSGDPRARLRWPGSGGQRKKGRASATVNLGVRLR